MARCRLTERITIENYEESKQNENGFIVEGWKEHYSCWSDFKTIKGSEYVGAKATNSENIVTFTIRYCKKVKELLQPGASKIFRIKHNNCYYDILYSSDYDNLHEWIDIKCKILT